MADLDNDTDDPVTEYILAQNSYWSLMVSNQDNDEITQNLILRVFETLPEQKELKALEDKINKLGVDSRVEKTSHCMFALNVYQKMVRKACMQVKLNKVMGGEMKYLTYVLFAVPFLCFLLGCAEDPIVDDENVVSCELACIEPRIDNGRCDCNRIY